MKILANLRKKLIICSKFGCLFKLYNQYVYKLTKTMKIHITGFYYTLFFFVVNKLLFV